MPVNPLKVLILHGPNLNLTGYREPDVYGKKTLEEIDAEIAQAAEEMKIELRTTQSNSEGVLIDAIHQHRRQGSEASAVINAFDALPAQQQQAMLVFLRSL